MKVTDRRFIKTENAIKESLIALLENNEFEKLQILDLTEKANINKSTFYLHYRSLDDVLGALEDQFVADISCLPCFHGTISFDHNMFSFLCDYVQKNRKLSRSVLVTFSGRFQNKLIDLMFLIYGFGPVNSIKRFTDEKTIRFAALSTSIFCVLKYWALGNFKLDKEKVIGILDKTISSEVYSDFIKR